MSLASQITLLATRVGQEIKAIRNEIAALPSGRGQLPQTFAYSGTVAVLVDAQAIPWFNDTGRTLTIGTVRVTLVTAPTGANLTIDIHKNGTTIFTTQSNRPTVAANTKTVLSAIPDVTTLANGDYLSLNVDQVGSVVAGATMNVTVMLS